MPQLLTTGAAGPGRGCLQRTRSPDGASSLQEHLETRWKASSGRRLLCRYCEEPITADGFRCAIGGRHLHHRTNPAGFSFEFGCFSEAPGATASGTPTSEHTWFPGYTWRFALCGTCGEQLGWLFEGGEPSQFHGLIGERLVPEEEEPPPI